MSTLWGTPGNLRLVVIDAETCVAPDGSHRVVSLGAVTCWAGGIRARQSWFVNPGVPIDWKTQTIHGITDDDLVAAPSIAEVLPDFVRLLGSKSYTTVLCVHNANFDIPVLRNEAARVNAAALPDLPVLDTAGRLPKLAGLTLASRKLEALLAALTIGNTKSHDSLGDAEATAKAACELLRRAEDAGHTDLAKLLASAGVAQVAAIVAAKTPKPIATQTIAPYQPPTHIATHTVVVTKKPRAADLVKWTSWIDECATLRCASLTTRSELLPIAVLRPLLFEALVTRAAAFDGPGVATVLGALCPLLPSIPTRIAVMRQEIPTLRGAPGRKDARGVAISLAEWIEAVVGSVPRCSDDDPCPDCREARPCPRDIWPAALAPMTVPATAGAVTMFWPGTAALGAVAPVTPGYPNAAAVHRPLADALLRLCRRFWIDERRPADADILVEEAWRTGNCRDPKIVEAHLLITARPGQVADLTAAVADGRATLALYAGSTDPAWSSLRLRVAQLEAKLARMAAPAKRPHHAINPRRPPRPPRFFRSIA